MLPSTSEMQIRLAQIVSIVAAIATLSVWRANALPQIKKQLHTLRQIRQIGFYPGWVTRAYYVRYLEMWLWATGLLLSAVFLWHAIHFFHLTNSLIGNVALDINLLQRIQGHADSVKELAVSSGVLSIVFLVVQWLLTMITPEWRLPSTELPTETHPYNVPPEYRASESALWEYRLERLIDLNPTGASAEFIEAHRTGSWRSDWSVWARCVVEYHSYAQGAAQQFYANMSGL